MLDTAARALPTLHAAIVYFAACINPRAAVSLKPLTHAQVNASYPEQPNLQPFRRGSKWVSTGIYASPGATITVTLPASVTLTAGKEELAVRIGSHTDAITHKPNWCRQPYDVTKVVPFTAAGGRTLSLASNHGGLVYLIVTRVSPMRLNLT